MLRGESPTFIEVFDNYDYIFKPFLLNFKYMNFPLICKHRSSMPNLENCELSINA